jgi:hypothetical protein
MKSELGQGILPKQQLLKGRDKALNHQDLEQIKVPVRINNRTIIYVLPSKVAGAKERYLKNHQM